MMLLECVILGMIAFLMTGAHCEVTEVLAEAGSQAVLPCKCSSTSPVPSGIIWSKANKGGDYSLQINDVREEDGGLYSCSLECGNQVIENKVMLRIITVSVSPLVPVWGRDASVTCNVTPWPDGAAVQWMLNNSPFVCQSGTTLRTDTPQNVVKERATARLTGNWTCLVRYMWKEGEASASLSVKGIIQPPDDNTKVYAAVGSTVALPCVFSHDLVPSSLIWEKLQPGSRSKPVFSRLPPSFSPSQPSQLPWDKSVSLKEVELKDEGKYRCSGTIQGQRLARNMQLIVAKIDSSSLSKKKDSVTLTCQLSDASEVTDYEWVHVTYDINDTQSVGSIQKGKTLNIDQVSEENWGEWTCGLSGQKSKGFSHNTATVVGLSFLLLVLLLILAQMYKNHQRRKRILQYPALETIVHTISNEREERERSRVKK
ncbi:lymphocyte activation gene 3 protein [Lates japonicus]|uniref:Lymphocyte activation gene 3 protein n=1 Tax=Lates japonicus TaxID=270547 RepID=A0AAD3N2C6_LATJO|nr:lymphocyte activation gene 3 protein [Lates japonicus]